MRLKSLLSAALAFLAFTALAQKEPDYHDTKKYTTDLNHQGWTGAFRGSRIEWVPIKASCVECAPLADEYNALANELLSVRHSRNVVQQDYQKVRDRVKQDAPRTREPGEEARAVVAMANLGNAVENTLKNLRKDEEILMAKLKRLAKTLSDCNLRCPDGTIVDALEGVRPVVRVSNPYDPPFANVNADELKELVLPFPWAGPYREVCLRCAKLAERLNALRPLTLGALFNIEHQKRDAERVRLAQKLRDRLRDAARSLQFAMLDLFEYGTYGLRPSRYEDSDDIERYTQNFHATLKLYQDCVKTCPKPGERQAFNLSDPIRIPVPKVTGGQAVESVAQGIAGGVLGGLTRGMLGGGGGERQAPPLVARPNHPEQSLTSKDGKTSIRLAGAALPEGCQVTLGVQQSPGNGAPHLIALQDANGNTMQPSKIAVYQIWEARGEWTLNVSWTKSYYQDGQLVRQEKGGWTANWTEVLGRYKTPGELPAIWQDFGGRPFDGARGVVADFQLPAGQAFNSADWNLVAHVATRDGDSIVTQPFVASMNAAEKGSLSFTQHEHTVWEAKGR
ncbi:MAG: hypothetical protein IT513_16435 [Burkholderiales bacterium]|nr:hypothetical protein [Burkholderiales bacterium]